MNNSPILESPQILLEDHKRGRATRYQKLETLMQPSDRQADDGMDFHDKSNREGILSTLRELKRDRGEALGIVELGIFGSCARDSATASSDLDVYIKTKTPGPYLLVHIKDAIEGRVHRRVDIVRLRERMNPLLKARIEREGIDV